jgi:hypothetical protein
MPATPGRKSFTKAKAAPVEPTPVNETKKVTIIVSQAQWEQLREIAIHDRANPSLQSMFITAIRRHLDEKGMKLVD